MIIFLPLNNSDIRRHLSSPEIRGDAAPTHLHFQNSNMKTIQETVLKCKLLSSKEIFYTCF